MEIVLPDLQEGFVRLANTVAAAGHPARPRGLETREVLGVSLIFPNVRNLLPVGVGRRVSTTFNAAGAACLVGGVDYPDMLIRIAPRFADFDADGVDREKYGPRTHRQIVGAVRHLMDDPHTREAVAVLQPPRSDAADGGRVFPCTTFVQFFARRGKLDMQVCMRSNDVWNGLSGDAWMFSQLMRTVAWALRLEPGTYRHFTSSLHIYEEGSGVPGMDRLSELHAASKPGIDVPGFGYAPDEIEDGSVAYMAADDRMEAAQGWARRALGLNAQDFRPPRSLSWYANKLRPYWVDAAVCRRCRTVVVRPGDTCACPPPTFAEMLP